MEEVYFEKELGYIKNEEVRNNCIEVLKHVNEEFYHAPASTTGKYHPEYSLGDGGLYRHTCAAVRIAQCMRENIVVQNFTDDEFDYIIAALILHDTCKCGKNWDSKYTKHSHPIEAVQLVDEVLPDTYFSAKMTALISTHMGQWTTCKWDKTELPYPDTPAQMFVHLCDYLASRRFIEINFDKEV